MTVWEVEEGGERLDKYLSGARPDLSRAYVQRLIEQGHVRVSGEEARASRRLKAGEVVELLLPPPEAAGPEPEPVRLNIVYEDDDILVVDKPAGMTVHPAPGHPRGTLVNALLAHVPGLQGTGGELRPGIVHRLDRDTSGLMVVAKTSRAHESLSSQFKRRSLKKRYLALVRGRMSPEAGAIEAPIGRHPVHRQRMAVVEGGREARTGYRVIRALDGFSLVEASPLTGRTHQIRVHFAAVGHPVAGDRMYGEKSRLVDRQFLHASYLAFVHPATGKQMEFRSELPADLNKALEKVGGEEKDGLLRRQAPFDKLWAGSRNDRRGEGR